MLKTTSSIFLGPRTLKTVEFVAYFSNTEKEIMWIGSQKKEEKEKERKEELERKQKIYDRQRSIEIVRNIYKTQAVLVMPCTVMT